MNTALSLEAANRPLLRLARSPELFAKRRVFLGHRLTLETELLGRKPILLAFVSIFAKQRVMLPPGEAEFDLGEDLKRRLQPHLEELGVEAFVILGYAKKGDGRTMRLVVVNDGQDVAYQDGLRSAIMFAMAWSGPMARPARPSDEKSDSPG